PAGPQTAARATTARGGRKLPATRPTLHRLGEKEQNVNRKPTPWQAGPLPARPSAAARTAATPRPRIDRVPPTAYIATMALRDILILPDKRLRQVFQPVKKNDARIRQPNEDMFETMYHAARVRPAPLPVAT